MIASLLSRWLKPPFYVCDFNEFPNVDYDPRSFIMHGAQTFDCIGDNRKDAEDYAERSLHGKLKIGLGAIYQVRPATLRERLK